MLISIIAAVAIFAILIIVHEAGHFMVAKRAGVRVLRFSIGYPPRIFGLRRGETDYALGATPFGGYVRMLGDETSDEPSSDTLKSYLKELELDLLGAAKSTGALAHQAQGAQMAMAVGERASHADGAPAASADPGERALVAIADELGGAQGEVAAERAVVILGREARPDEQLLLGAIYRCGSVKLAVDELSARRPSALLTAFNERAFPSQRLAKRFAIVLAGPVFNLLFAPILMVIVFMIGVPTLLPVIGNAKPGMPAFAAGLLPGDRVTAVDGKKIASWDELSDTVKASKGAPLHLTIARPASSPHHFELTIVPKRLPEETIYGNTAPTWVIGVTPRGDKITLSYGPLAAVRAGSVETARMLVTLCVGIGRIFDGTTPVRQALGGPIMIAQIAGKEAHQGFADLALFTVMLSLELGIINLLPVPLLDGGHLLFFVIEGMRGKPLQLRHREIAMQVGLFFLMVLMAFLILNDLSRIVG